MKNNIYAKYLNESIVNEAFSDKRWYVNAGKNGKLFILTETINDEDVSKNKLFKVIKIEVKVEKDLRESFKLTKPYVVSDGLEMAIEKDLTYNCEVKLVDSKGKDIGEKIGNEIISKYETKKYTNTFEFNDLYVKIIPSTKFDVYDYRPFKK